MLCLHRGARPWLCLLPLLLAMPLVACTGPEPGVDDDGGPVIAVDGGADGSPDAFVPAADAVDGRPTDDRGSAASDLPSADAVEPGGDGGGLPDGRGVDSVGIDAGPADLPGPTPDATNPGPEPGPSPRRVRVMTYNIKRGSVTSIAAIADVINAENPHVVGLQEVFEGSGSNTRSNATMLGSLTGMEHVFRAAKAVDGGHTGLAVLSRFPIVGAERVLLTSGNEQRILLLVRVRLTDGRVLTVANTHFGLTVDERQAQAAEVRDQVRGRQRLTLTGDFNSFSDGAVHIMIRQVVEDSWMEAGSGAGNTSPAGAPRNRIDYIYRSADWERAQNAHVVDTQASDHRPVVVDLIRADSDGP